MGKKILVVEDEESVFKLIKICLHKAGFEVIHARDGMQGYDMARKESPDLIILDFMLPKMDGLKVARLLRHDRAHAGIPIVFATAGNPEEAEMGIEENLAEAYIPKPFEFDELIGTINRVLADKASEEASEE